MIKEHDMIQERILELVKYGLTSGLTLLMRYTQ